MTDTGLMIYPNPITQTLFAEFELRSNTDVIIELVNVSGQNVQTLFNGQLISGTHTLPLQVRDIPNGVYAFVLRTADQVITKMVIKN